MKTIHGLGDQSIQDQIIAEANAQGVDPNLALAVAQQESGFNQNVTGSSGEVGVFQLMPNTAAGLGVDPYDTSQNIQGGIAYLKQQLNASGGDVSSAVAAYNAGPSAISGNWPSSTQSYVNSVLAKYQALGGTTPLSTGGGASSGLDMVAVGIAAGLVVTLYLLNR